MERIEVTLWEFYMTVTKTTTYNKADDTMIVLQKAPPQYSFFLDFTLYAFALCL